METTRPTTAHSPPNKASTPRSRASATSCAARTARARCNTCRADLDALAAEQAEAVGAEHRSSLESPYRWRDWAPPPELSFPIADANAGELPQGWKRQELANSTLGAFFGSVNGKLIPHLRGLKERPNATPKQQVISEIMSGVERVRADSERSWTVTRAEIEVKIFDLKAVNPTAKNDEDKRTPEELLDVIEAKGREVADALAILKKPT